MWQGNTRVISKIFLVCLLFMGNNEFNLILLGPWCALSEEGRATFTRRHKKVELIFHKNAGSGCGDNREHWPADYTYKLFLSFFALLQLWQTFSYASSSLSTHLFPSGKLRRKFLLSYQIRSCFSPSSSSSSFFLFLFYWTRCCFPEWKVEDYYFHLINLNFRTRFGRKNLLSEYFVSEFGSEWNFPLNPTKRQ